MQFKRGGRRIQVLAYRGYDREKRRAIVKLLGSMDAYTYEMSAALANTLTAEEKSEVQAYIENKRKSEQESHQRYVAQTLAERMNDVAESIDTEMFKGSDDWAVGVWAALERLKKSLRKAGYAKPQLPPKVKDDKARLERNGQRRLLD